MSKTVTVAIVELRDNLLNLVNDSGLPPIITGMVLHDLARAVDEAAQQQYDKDIAASEEDEPTESE